MDFFMALCYAVVPVYTRIISQSSLRSYPLGNHTAVGRALEALEQTNQKKYPSHDSLLHGYLHFEALTAHDYNFSCVNCGDHPPVVILDLHKKGVFSMPVSDVKDPPPEFDGHVDIEEFWQSVAQEIVCRGFVKSNRENLFAITPAYDKWAPWIGPRTRASKTVINTEYAKMNAKKSSVEQAEVEITEERLSSDLMNLKINYILDEQRPMNEIIVKDGQTCLTRENFLTLGLRQEMDSVVDSHNKDVLIFPLWTPGHYLLCGLPKQTSGNDCGIFMIMYSWYVAMEARFDFTINDMPYLRRFWCKILVENLQIEGHGRKFAHFTEQGKKTMSGNLQTVFRISRKRRQEEVTTAEREIGLLLSRTQKEATEQGNLSFFEKGADSIDEAEEYLKRNGLMEDAWAQICPESERERLEITDTPREDDAANSGSVTTIGDSGCLSGKHVIQLALHEADWLNQTYDARLAVLGELLQLGQKEQ
ncbi:hypothetical protein NFI96_001065 [Prochilodus magdalenae]|nr:hypothetical protein NFI96_001065 [Prochilodus magdalenae]